MNQLQCSSFQWKSNTDYCFSWLLVLGLPTGSQSATRDLVDYYVTKIVLLMTSNGEQTLANDTSGKHTSADKTRRPVLNILIRQDYALLHTLIK